MADDEYDEDLARAIALSLQEANGNDDDEPSISGGSASKETNGKKATSNVVLTSDDKAQTSTGGGSSEKSNEQKPGGILGLDRAAMERERLARAARMKRARDGEISPPPVAKKARSEMAKKWSSGVASGELRFPKGAIKKTFAKGFTPDSNTVALEEILDKNNLKIAVLSTFIHDMDWLLPTKFDMSRTKFCFILHAKSASDRRLIEDDFKGVKQARVCLPSWHGGSMHSKLMLLFFEGYLRIVVPTANLVDFDWGETGVMENTVWLIDLPRLESEALQDGPKTQFAESLDWFLQRQGVEKDVVAGLHKFDFSATKGIAFVHTAAGIQLDDDARKTGVLGLSAAVRALNLNTTNAIQIDYATSSLGSLNDTQITTLYKACQGINLTSAPSSTTKEPSTDTIKKNTRIYFPTHATVAASRGGTSSGGTICLSSTHFAKNDFPRECLRDYISTRTGLLSHNKILLVRDAADVPNRGRVLGTSDDEAIRSEPIGSDSRSTFQASSKAYTYIGSANLSESAWGKLTLGSGTTKGIKHRVKLTCRNWECGVLVPVREVGADGEGEEGGVRGRNERDAAGRSERDAAGRSERDARVKSEGKAKSLRERFAGVVDVPFRSVDEVQAKGLEYGERKPWFFMDQ